MNLLNLARVASFIPSIQEKEVDPARPSNDNPHPQSRSAGEACAFSVAGGGDLDGDGVPDLVVGSPGTEGAGPFAGIVQALLGKDGEVLGRTGGVVREPGTWRAGVRVVRRGRLATLPLPVRHP